VKIEGELHGVPLFEQLVVLRECDLYHTWAPFTSKSRKLAQLDKLDVVAWFIVGVPALGLTRDACYRAVGCDCMNENGSVLLVAVGLNDTEEFGVRDGFNNEGTSNRKHADVGKKEDDLVQDYDTNEESEQQHTTSSPNSSTFLARDEILSTLEIPHTPWYGKRSDDDTQLLCQYRDSESNRGKDEDGRQYRSQFTAYAPIRNRLCHEEDVRNHIIAAASNGKEGGEGSGKKSPCKKNSGGCSILPRLALS
jgi:hypothetical protein